MSRGLGLLVGVLVWLAPLVALAHTRVVLVVPDEATRSGSLAEERLRAELLTAGYEVVTVPAEGNIDQSRLRVIARSTRATAAVSVRVGASSIDGAVWVKDDVTGQESMEQVRPAQATLDGAAEFAIWAAEQLRASVLAFDTHEPSNEPSNPTPPAASRQPEREPPRSEPAPKALPPARRAPGVETNHAGSQYAAAASLTVLAGPGGVPAGIGPSVALSWQPGTWFGSLWLIGPATSRLETESGAVDIDQELALLRVGGGFDFHASRVAPFAALGLGAYRFGARGDAAPPYESSSDQAWCGVLLAEGGLRVRLSELLFVVGEAGVWVGSTRTVLRVAGSPAVHTGRPVYVGSLGLGVSW